MVDNMERQGPPSKRVDRGPWRTHRRPKQPPIALESKKGEVFDAHIARKIGQKWDSPSTHSSGGTRVLWARKDKSAKVQRWDPHS